MKPCRMKDCGQEHPDTPGVTHAGFTKRGRQVWIASWSQYGKQWQEKCSTYEQAVTRRRNAERDKALGVNLAEAKRAERAEHTPPVTVLDVLDFYAARPLEDGEPRSDRGAQHRAAFAGSELAKRPAEDFALADMEGYVVARHSVAKRKASAATCAKDFRYLKAACAYAKAKGKIERHYFENLAGDTTTRKRLMPAYRSEDSKGKEIPPAHLEAILAKLHKDARGAVLFARTTGCRKDEVASLDWRKHWTPEGFEPIVQKGSSPRVVACDPAIVGPRGIGLVFAKLGATEEAIYARLTACWRYAVKAAKVGHYRFHDLRHSYGTELRAAGRSFDDIAAIMGITAAMAHVYAHEDRRAIQLEAIRAGLGLA